MSTMLKHLYGENFPDSNFCKLKGLNNLEKHYFSHPEMSSELRKHLQESFSTNFSMSERKQVQIMKAWLAYMWEEFVAKENVSLLNKLRNAQIIIWFSLWYLWDSFAIEWKEKSDILSTILDLYFGIFDNYETVIEHRLEMKKKNILLKEQEKLAKEYRKKYESAMKQVTALQK